MIETGNKNRKIKSRRSEVRLHADGRRSKGGCRKSRYGSVASRVLLLASAFSILVGPAFAQESNCGCSANTSLELREQILGDPIDVSGDAPVIHRKSPALAAFASLAVPGLGELYAGRYDVGKYSTIAEVSLWAFYTAVEVYSNQVKNDAIDFASIYAGANVVGKSSQYFVDIGNFMNTADYQAVHIQTGDYGGAIKYQAATYQWQWQSDADRTRFKNLRIKADNYLNIGRYTLAVIFLNHIISAVDAARLTSAINAEAETSLNGTPGTEGMYLKVSAGF